MVEDDLGQLFAHCHDRVQRRHGVLRDHGDPVAAHFLIFPLGVVDDVFPLEDDLSVFDDAGRVGDQLHDGQRRRGFSGAGLSHQAKALALCQGEGDPVHRLCDSCVGFIVYVEIMDL